MNALLSKCNVGSVAQLVERAGPYLLLELLLPGGTLFALLLFVYRNRPFRARIDPPARTQVAVTRVVAGVRRIALPPQGVAALAEAGTVVAPFTLAQ